MNFVNKVVLVTRASAGIGKATATLIAARGARLALVGRNAQNLRDVADARAKEKGLQPLAIAAKLATDEGCERTAKETLAHYGRLDVLINNAGVGARTNLEHADMETFDQAALDHFTCLTALELAPKGVRVNTVSPGVTVTDLVRRLTGMTDKEYSDFVKDVAGAIPMKRVCEAEHIAKTIVFLASDESEVTTGTIVKGDAGGELGMDASFIANQMKKMLQ